MMTTPRCDIRAGTAITAAALTLLLAVVGCAAPNLERTTRLTGDDLREISTEFAAALNDSELIVERTPDSQPWIVSITKVVNLSSDIMTESDKWIVMQRLATSSSLDALRQQRNMRFVIPREKLIALGREAVEQEMGDLPTRYVPTHTMTATFHSINRGTARGQVELYYCQFEVFELDTQKLVFASDVQIKRVARGHVWD